MRRSALDEFINIGYATFAIFKQSKLLYFETFKQSKLLYFKTLCMQVTLATVTYISHLLQYLSI